MKKYFSILLLAVTSLIWVQSCRTIDSKSVGDFVDSVSENVSDIVADVRDGRRQPQRSQAGTNTRTKQSPQQTESGGGLIAVAESLGIDRQTAKIAQKSVELGQAVLQPIGYKEELTIGGSLALEAVHKFGGIYKNPVLQNYVNLVGKSLAEVSERPEIDYHFAILNTDQPNGFATPGGYVFVSVGLLRLLQNEAQLAGVLGHEIAHIAQKHALKTLQRSKILSGMSGLTMAALNKDDGMLNKVILEASNMIFTHGLDKDLEFEADKLGMEYAYRMGYHPSGLKGFLDILGKSSLLKSSIFFSTHPSIPDRLLGLGQLLPQYKGVDHYPSLPTRYQSRIKGQLIKVMG